MTHIQQRRDTAANWTSLNPVLLDGEMGWEKDTLKGKMGDGDTAWNDLPYTVDPSTADDAVLALKAPIDSPVFSGDPQVPTPVEFDNDFSITNTQWVRAAIAAAVEDALQEAYASAILADKPVGTLYFSTTSTNPESYLGGSWEAFGQGKALIGVDPTSPFFKEGMSAGAVTHTHGLTEASAAIIMASTTISLVSRRITAAETWTANLQENVSPAPVGSSLSETLGTALIGDTDYASSLPPYVTVYVWKRTA